MAKPILYDLKEHDYMEGKQTGLRTEYGKDLSVCEIPIIQFK